MAKKKQAKKTAKRTKKKATKKPSAKVATIKMDPGLTKKQIQEITKKVSSAMLEKYEGKLTTATAQLRAKLRTAEVNEEAYQKRIDELTEEAQKVKDAYVLRESKEYQDAAEIIIKLRSELDESRTSIIYLVEKWDEFLGMTFKERADRFKLIQLLITIGEATDSVIKDKDYDLLKQKALFDDGK